MTKFSRVLTDFLPISMSKKVYSLPKKAKIDIDFFRVARPPNERFSIGGRYQIYNRYIVQLEIFDGTLFGRTLFGRTLF
jgi:hypothetical protein